MSELRNGIMGVCVGDALGVPVEFMAREDLAEQPVNGMQAYGTHRQPAGTWSDDTSLTLCLLDSLTHGLDVRDIMERFADWYVHGAYTPTGEAFDIGMGTRMAIDRFLRGTEPLDCGGLGERNNGNGALMRSLPLVFYLRAVHGEGLARRIHEEPQIMEVIHDVCRLTHGHRRSQIACGLYVLIAEGLIGSEDREAAVRNGLEQAALWYKSLPDYVEELKEYSRLLDPGFHALPEEQINSGGYVVHTLEAALWCFLGSDRYRSCVLKAVNLGDDTDTVAAVSGGLAGLFYGFQSIPPEWVETIVRRDFVEDLCENAWQVFRGMRDHG